MAIEAWGTGTSFTQLSSGFIDITDFEGSVAFLGPLFSARAANGLSEVKVMSSTETPISPGPDYYALRDDLQAAGLFVSLNTVTGVMTVSWP